MTTLLRTLYADLKENLVSFWVPTSKLQLTLSQANLFNSALATKNIRIDYKNSRLGMNYVILQRNQQETAAKDTLVLMHGFGCGSAHFFRNIHALTSQYKKVILADWLGMGCSVRFHHNDEVFSPRMDLPSILYKMTSGKSAHANAVDDVFYEKAVNFFTSSLNDLVENENEIEGQFHLAGHSLGGFLVSKYASIYPDRVQRLILLSPVGVEEVPPVENRIESSDAPNRLKLAQLFWQSNLTPQSVVRAMGPRGSQMTDGYVERVFNRRGNLNARELELVKEYMYHVSAADKSGEYALNSLLAPIVYKRRHDGAVKTGVFAKQDIQEEIVKTFGNQADKRVLLVYGDNDWFHFNECRKVVEKWRERNVNVDYEVIDQAGHHFYIDNEQRFAEIIDEFSQKK